LWQSGQLDPDAIWDGEWNRSRDGHVDVLPDLLTNILCTYSFFSTSCNKIGSINILCHSHSSVWVMVLLTLMADNLVFPPRQGSVEH